MIAGLSIFVFILLFSQVLVEKSQHICGKLDWISYYAKTSCNCLETTQSIEKPVEIHLKESDKTATTNMASDSTSYGFYRPRSALARALYEKQSNDRYLQDFDQNEVSVFSTYNLLSVFTIIHLYLMLSFMV